MKWISIKEEMPPDGQAVILCIEINYSVGYIYTSGAFVGGRWKLNESHDLLDTDCYEYSDGSYDDDITHWMSLPPPPSSSNSDYAKSKSCANCSKLYQCNDVRKHPEWHCEKHDFA